MSVFVVLKGCNCYIYLFCDVHPIDTIQGEKMAGKGKILDVFAQLSGVHGPSSFLVIRVINYGGLLISIRLGSFQHLECRRECHSTSSFSWRG